MEGIRGLYLTARKYHLLPPPLDVEPADWILKLVQHLLSFSLLQINTVSYEPLKSWVFNQSARHFQHCQAGPSLVQKKEKICITNIKGRWERIAEILISALAEGNHLWAWSSPTWMFRQPRWAATQKCLLLHPAALCTPLVLCDCTQFFLFFHFQRLRRGKKGQINCNGPERCLWRVLTLGRLAVVGLGETWHHLSTSHVQDCCLYKILHRTE